MKTGNDSIVIREQPFNSRIGYELVLALDKELVVMFPDWDQITHPNRIPGNVAVDGRLNEDSPRPRLDLESQSPSTEAKADDLKFYVAFASPKEGEELTPIGCVALRYMPFFPHHKQSENPVEQTQSSRTEPSSAEIKRMYVVPEARGSGVADKLIQHIEKVCRDELKLDRLVLETGDRQIAAIKLYKRHGFIDRSLFGVYVGGGPEDGGISICMEKFLS